MKKISTFLVLVSLGLMGTAQVKKTTATTTTKKTTATAPATNTAAKRTTLGGPPTPATAAKKPVAKDMSVKVKITTDSGVIMLKLYDSTPLHRDNFVKLIKQGFYDSLLFHRVIPEFMIQGGDPLSKNAAPGTMLGMGGGDMQRIPAEFKGTYFHKKGALAAARDNNPEKASSACQFYIVEGKKFSDDDLDAMEQQGGIKFTADQRTYYKTIGGTPFLDQNYTVFGETISGMDVITKIAHASADGSNRPVGDIHMKMEIVK